MNHAGFAAAAVFRADVLEEVLRLLHSTDAIPVRARDRMTAEIPGLGNTELEFDLYLEPPRPFLQAGRSPAVDLVLTGSLRTTQRPSGEVQHRRIRIEGRIAATIGVTTSADAMMLTLGITPTITSIAIRVVEGAPLPRATRDFLAGPFLRLQLQGSLRDMLASNPPATPPVFHQILAVFRSFGLTPSNITVRSLDGAAALALDVSGSVDGTEIRTTGDPARLADFAGESRVAVSVHPSVIVPLLTRAWESAPGRRYSPIRSVRFSLAPDAIRLEGTVHRRGVGDMSFRANLRPEVTATHIALRVTDASVDAPAWVHLLAVILGPIGVGVEAAVSSSLTDGANAAERDVPFSTLRQQVFSIPGAGGALVRLRVDRMQVGTPGLDGWSHFELDTRQSLAVLGPTHLSRRLLAPVRYRLDIRPGAFQPQDPAVRVRWEVRRADTSGIVTQSDLPVADPASHSITFDPLQPELFSVNAYRIYCRVYRTVEGGPRDLFDQRVDLALLDRISTAQPYVRWRHQVIVPWVRFVERGGVRVRTVRDRWVRRASRIHRTDLPGRCLMVDRFSAYVLESPDARRPVAPVLEYLDTLPFPRSDLIPNRRQVCDYCFFGSPTRETPII